MNRSALVAPALVVLVAIGAACGGSSKDATPAVELEVAGPTPSNTARMLCEPEVRDDLEAALGVAATKITKPTWNVEKHVYSCTYQYPGGARMTLTVKELSSAEETTRYFDSLAESLGRGETLEIGQGAYRTTNGSLVVRKDYKVLFIDVSLLPEQFGKPPIGREEVAVNVGSVIMACWIEA